jgi:hypothetical protein
MQSAVKVLLLFFSMARTSVSSLSESNEDRNMHKVKFDLFDINDEGLIGPPGGLRSVSYEFCIPISDEALEAVLNIDSTIQHYTSSRGRIMCPVGQQLCIAETYNEDNRGVPTTTGVPKWKEVLRSLSQLDFIDRFEQSFGE